MTYDVPRTGKLDSRVQYLVVCDTLLKLDGLKNSSVYIFIFKYHQMIRIRCCTTEDLVVTNRPTHYYSSLLYTHDSSNRKQKWRFCFWKRHFITICYWTRLHNLYINPSTVYLLGTHDCVLHRISSIVPSLLERDRFPPPHSASQSVQFAPANGSRVKSHTNLMLVCKHICKKKLQYYESKHTPISSPPARWKTRQ